MRCCGAWLRLVCPLVSAADRARLEAIVGRSQPCPEARGAGADHPGARPTGCSVAEVARRAGVGRPAVWRWQRRFAEAGVDGLLRDATRKPGKAPLGRRRPWTGWWRCTCAEPPGEATHWTGRAMAEAAGVSLALGAADLGGARLQPHRIRSFKRSTDPAFAAKLEDIVGLYLDPPEHAVVLSVDEKSQIQALDRTQPGPAAQAGQGRDHDPSMHVPRSARAFLNDLA